MQAIAEHTRALLRLAGGEHPHHLEADGGRERVAAEGRAVLAGLEHADHVAVADDCGDGHDAAAERLAEQVEVGHDADAHDDFGPYTPGFRTVPYGDAAAVEAAIDENTVAVLVEPIQGEAGILVPPADFLPSVRAICTERNVLLMADEIQSGLGRVGATFACELVGVVPDLYLLGKALGGGIVPVSAVVGDRDVLGVLQPGQHGSTFGGNPLAAAVGLEVVRMLASGEPQERARMLGAHLHDRLESLVGRGVIAVRGAGLWAGVDIDPAIGTGREVCEALMRRGVLAKDTRGSTIRLAPPIVVEQADLDWAVDRLAEVLEELAG